MLTGMRGLSVSLVVIAALACLRLGQPSQGQAKADRGWIEGVVINEAGLPVNHYNPGTPLTLRFVSQDGREHVAPVHMTEGGFYTLRGVTPGIYEVFVPRTMRRKNNQELAYRPQHLFTVAVRNDTRTYLKIVVHPGTEIEEIGKPSVGTQVVVNISEELLKLQMQIDELKKRK